MSKQTGRHKSGILEKILIFKNIFRLFISKSKIAEISIALSAVTLITIEPYLILLLIKSLNPLATSDAKNAATLLFFMLS